MSITAPVPTLGTLSGTQVTFFPVPTAWPSQPGCDQYIYRENGAPIYLAWDPIFAKDLVDAARSCFPEQMTAWWLQDHNAAILTSLGPNFECPGAFSTAAAVTHTGTAQETVQSIYCCPSNYGLNIIQTNIFDFPSQCTSVVSVGQTFSYISYLSSLPPQTITSTVTVGGTVSLVTLTTRSSLRSSTTIVQETAATVYAVPINGINIVQWDQTTSNQTTSTPPAASGQPAPSNTSATSPSSRTSPAVIAGAVIASVLGLLALLDLGYFFFRRRRASPHVMDHVRQQHGTAGPGPGPGGYPTYGGVMYEAPNKTESHELSHDRLAHEMPAPQVYELPGRNSHIKT